MKPLDDQEQRELLVRAELPTEADPIWGQAAHVYDSFAGYWLVLSDRSGSYACGPGLRGTLQAWTDAEKAKLTSWIVDQNRGGLRFPWLTADVLQAVLNSRPLRFSKKIERVFEYLNSVGYRPGDLLVPVSVGETPESTAARHTLMRWSEAANENEYYGLIQALLSDNLVSAESQRLQLTAKGLNRLDDLDAKGASNDQAFVAMWFDPSMEDVFENGIAPAIADAGYRAVRVDRVEHINKIDDEIVAAIRRSRFLVADFTCGVLDSKDGPTALPRGGVYYEAGLAQGLGMPVFWTVRADQLAQVHFDIRQYNQIDWSDPADLRLRLRNRISAVLGDFVGP